jgi:DNA invertase Pin-like site-specific DNA recombinase
MPMRVVLYTRVSLDRRENRRSVEEQETALRVIAEREGWEVLRVFTDNDRSASRFARKQRPEYQALLDYIGQEGVDVVAVWELSRLSRDLGMLVAFRDLCRKHDVVWSVGGRLYDPSDDRDTMGIIVNAVQAENESAQTSKRVRRATAATAHAGKPHGRVLYGYARQYDPDTRAFIAQVIDKEPAAVVREIANRFLGAESLYSISKDLNVRKVPTPSNAKEWYATNLSRLLRNPGYVGQRVHQGNVIGDAAWPPILTWDIWHPLQRKLNDPNRRSRSDAARRHLLTGLITCAQCGSQRIYSTKQANGGNPYRAYVCFSCFGASKREDFLDDYVERFVVTLLSRPDTLEVFRPPAKRVDAASSAQAQIREYRTRLDDVSARAARGDFSLDMLGRIERKLLQEITMLEDRARRETMPPALQELAKVDVAGTWYELPIGTRREVIRELVTITISKSRPGGPGYFDLESVSITPRH